MKRYEDLSEAWRGFLTGLDGELTQRVNFACTGFVMEYYGSGRTTQDLDFYLSYPQIQGWQSLAGKGSVLGKKYKVWLHSACFNIPVGFDDRLTEMFPNQFKYLGLCALDPYDLILTKLHRHSEKDVLDVQFLFAKQNLEVETLKLRYSDLSQRNAETYSTFQMWLNLFRRNPSSPI
jgi:uncharacterized nucleotidyltransferase DUF6036